MTKHTYTRGGRPISEADALDNGVLRDGVSMHVAARFRDSEMTGDARAQFTDGSNDPTQANRPGWRLRIGDQRQAQHDAYAAYERDLTNRWRGGDNTQQVCPECDGSKFQSNGNTCETCGDLGYLGSTNAIVEQQDAGVISKVPSFDTRSLDEIMRSHRERMTQLYDQHDRELSEAWRQR